MGAGMSEDNKDEKASIDEDAVEQTAKPTKKTPLKVKALDATKRAAPKVTLMTKLGWKAAGGIVVLGGLILLPSQFKSAFNPAPPTVIAQDCTVLTPDVQAKILEKAQSPEEAAAYARALRCEVFPDSGVMVAENSPEDRFENSVKELAQSTDDIRRRGLVLAANAATRADGLDMLASVAKTVEDWTNIGELAYPWDTKRAINAYENGIAQGDANPWSYIYLSRLHQRGGDLSAAQGVLDEALGLPLNDRLGMVARTELGNVSVAQGNLGAAARLYRQALKATKTLASSDPSNAGYQRDLSVSYNKLGDVAVAQGDLSVASGYYGDGLEVAKTLASSDPSNAGYQRDLSVSYNKLGDVAVAQGDLSLASGYYGEGLVVRKTLASSDPLNAVYQRDLMASYYRLAQLDTGEAAGYWRQAFKVLNGLREAGRMKPADEATYQQLKSIVEGLD